MINRLSFCASNLRVVSGGGDGGAAVRIVHLTFGGDMLEVMSQPHGCRGTSTDNDWVVEMRVQLLDARRGLPGHKEKYFAMWTKIIDAEEGFVVLSPEEKQWLFSVNLETMEIKREYRRKKYTGAAFQYTLPWPPVLRACVENGRN
ncbi:uncharacterized protein C2845_PM03G31770 [Panicum miliaceum]|uniref:Uncharacterized protein n=1 Tax=Panicum miliaceum TaxID=4540 RepID=A0A3L6T5U0_PANMI|nr:uncharacterized protein C2845_PM03G31770 [Panicum miliaceum]